MFLHLSFLIPVPYSPVLHWFVSDCLLVLTLINLFSHAKLLSRLLHLNPIYEINISLSGWMKFIAIALHT